MKYLIPQYHRGGPFRLSVCRPAKKPAPKPRLRSLAEIEADFKKLQAAHRALSDALFGSREQRRREIAASIAQRRGISIEAAMKFIPD
ncbi:MAG: hypothetical protein Q8K78_07095 [Planctomycetaceae bacterium]|nr:hypothetical protein [Planctomycetaceae bacterium]